MGKSIGVVCREASEEFMKEGIGAEISSQHGKIFIGFTPPTIRDLGAESPEVDRVVREYCEGVREKMVRVRAILKEYGFAQETNKLPYSFGREERKD